MKIFYIKDRKIMKGDTEDFQYRAQVCTPLGVRDEVFLEDGKIKFWSGSQVKTLRTTEDVQKTWEKILWREFDEWCQVHGGPDYYHSLEDAIFRLEQLIQDENDEAHT